MKVGLVVASIVLVAGGAVGCGDGGGKGGGGASDDAPSATDFCAALKQFQDDFSDADPTADVQAYIETLKGAAERLEKVGTPDDMPDDAQEGFEITLDKITAVADDATLEDLSSMTDLTDEEKAKTEALDTYIAETCPGLSGE